MSTTSLEIKDKADDDNSFTPNVTRSVTRRRPASACGLRSKIPTIVNQNNPGSLMADPQVTLMSPHDTKVSMSHGKPKKLLPSRNITLSLSKGKISSINSSTRKNLEKQFRNKQNRYLIMRSEIEEKQRCALDMHEEISELRKKMIASGAKDPGKLEGIKLIADNSNKCSESEDLSKGSRGYGSVINASVSREFVSILENELRNYPKECVDLCEGILEKYSEIIERFNNYCNDKCDNADIKVELDECKVDGKNMKVQLEEAKKKLDELNGELIRKIIIMWEEIDGASLRIRDFETISDEVVNKLRSDLNAQSTKFNQLKDEKMSVDNELKKTNAKIQRQNVTIEAKDNEMCNYQEYIKSLETQVKQNDINFEHATRDLHKSLKNSEEMIISLESQRNNLEMRLSEMNKKLDEMMKNDEDVDILNRELAKYKDSLAKSQQEKSFIEKDLMDKLQKEKDLILKISDDYEELQKDRDVIEKKFNELEEQIMSFNSQHSHNMQRLTSSDFIKSNGDYRQEILLIQRKNIDLEANLNFISNQLQLKDQTLREQYQRIQVQDELINYLKDSVKNSNSGFNSGLQEINKEITAKSEAIKGLSEKLETKDLQLLRLEKLVKQMEDQDERAQEQRTRLERRIAQLELALQAKNNKDCRKKGISILQGMY